jgi:hypothetical protein
MSKKRHTKKFVCILKVQNISDAKTLRDLLAAEKIKCKIRECRTYYKIMVKRCVKNRGRHKNAIKKYDIINTLSKEDKTSQFSKNKRIYTHGNVHITAGQQKVGKSFVAQNLSNSIVTVGASNAGGSSQNIISIPGLGAVNVTVVGGGGGGGKSGEKKEE